jgi:hypothetical protein
MALINCPDCGAQVSSSAKKCVQCGWRRTVSKPQLFFALVVAFVALALGISIMFAQDTKVQNEDNSDSVYKKQMDEVSDMEKKRTDQLISQYQEAKSGEKGTLMCIMAGTVARHFEQKKDETNHKKWKQIEVQDCQNAGMPLSPH